MLKKKITKKDYEHFQKELVKLKTDFDKKVNKIRKEIEKRKLEDAKKLIEKH